MAFDPGIGFGKTAAHNLTLRELPTGVDDRPLVLGVSRKASLLASMSGAEAVSERLWPTVALTAILRERGARVLRVHEVRPNLLALRTVETLLDDG